MLKKYNNRNSWERSRIRPIVTDTSCRDSCNYKEIHPAAQPVILAANIGKNINFSGNNCRTKEELAAVTVDTTSLTNPLIKIDFTTNVKFKCEAFGCYVVNTFIQISFKLIKYCNGCSEKIGTWEYYQYFADAPDCALTRSLSDTFTFNYCTNDSSSECCVYKVIAEIKACNDASELSCNKNTISVIAQSQT